VGVLKVGLEAYVRWGTEALRVARREGAAVFLDLKLHDIPNTVAGAVRAAGDLGVSYLTLHAGGGPAMLAAAAAAREGAGGAKEPLRLLAVTLLTHLDDSQLAALDLPGEARTRVERWARLAAQAGCDGVVCSPLEVARLRAQHARPFCLVTPGIRPAGTDVGDQRRVTTPEAAWTDGADLLVIGRPLTQATDPAAALLGLEERLRTCRCPV
jgi:orotidine-5'-phosphate decarboxylase